MKRNKKYKGTKKKLLDNTDSLVSAFIFVILNDEIIIPVYDQI